jgi:hypothetical protein
VWQLSYTAKQISPRILRHLEAAWFGASIRKLPAQRINKRDEAFLKKMASAIRGQRASKVKGYFRGRSKSKSYISDSGT